MFSLFKLILLLTFTLNVTLFASPSSTLKKYGVSKEDISEFVDIAAAIRILRPRLRERKLISYSSAILKASQKYKINAKLLIGIAQQESSFRANLPVGRAGEIGICQIRKVWLRYPTFIKSFGRKRVRDLYRPKNNFEYAAWILKGLKERRDGLSSLPYWTYYNAVSFAPRKRYLKRVRSRIKKLDKLPFLHFKQYSKTQEFSKVDPLLTPQKQFENKIAYFQKNPLYYQRRLALKKTRKRRAKKRALTKLLKKYTVLTNNDPHSLMASFVKRDAPNYKNMPSKGNSRFLEKIIRTNQKTKKTIQF